jgi:hypothetical protein
VPPRPRIRSLAYFQPVIEELQEHPVAGGYFQYLRLKLRGIVDTPRRPKPKNLRFQMIANKQADSKVDTAIEALANL